MTNVFRGNSILYGNTIRASQVLEANVIRPIAPETVITIEGGIQTDDINLTATETNIGVNAGQSTTGQGNTFVGADAGRDNTTGDKNVFVGRIAGALNTTGEENVMIGHSAGLLNTSGEHCVYIGSSAGLNSTTPNNNTFVGRLSGFSNVTGDGNTLIGQSSALFNSTGRLNTCLGTNSGASNTTADENTFIGTSAGINVSSGSNNICIGNQARGPATGTYNVIIGDNAGFTVDPAMSSCVLIGHDVGANNTASNRLMIDETNTDDPLIDGDFLARKVILNGEVTLGQGAGNVHQINGSVLVSITPPPVNVNEYLLVKVNGANRRIPMYF